MTFNFGEVLTRAWQITWKYKVLWIFGILASCARNNGGGTGTSGWRGNRSDYPYNIQPGMERSWEWITAHWWVAALIVLAIIVLILLVVFLGTVGRIGLIRGTLQAETGPASLPFGDLFGGSMPFFWRVFALTFLVGLIFLLILLPFILFGVVTGGIGFICLLPLICVLALAGIVVNLIIELANVAIVKDNLTIADGWKRGWEMTRLNIGPVVLMALILFVITFVAGLMVALPIISIAVPVGIATAVGQANNTQPTALWVIAGLCILAYLPVAIFLSGIVNTYAGAAWTLTYLRLEPPAQENPPVPVEANA